MEYHIRLEQIRRVRDDVKPIETTISSLTELVFEAIKNAIIDGTISPGQLVSESQIADELGVSKTPVRESLLHLKHLGLVESDGRRLKVVLVSASRIREAYELRATLESSAARYAALRSDAKTKELLVDLASRSASLSAPEQFSEREQWDRKFHTVLAESSGNSQLSRAIDNAYLLTWILRLRDLPEGRRISCATDHLDVAKAVAGADGETASELMERHILTLRDRLLAARESNPLEATTKGGDTSRRSPVAIVDEAVRGIPSRESRTQVGS